MPIRHQLPKNPDPERYIEVHTKEGKFHRLKRGLRKPAQLNERLKENASAMSICSPAAKRILTTIKPYTQHLNMGRIQSRWNSLLIRHYNKTGRLPLSVLYGQDLQPDHPFSQLCTCGHYCERQGREISLVVRPLPGSVRQLNGLVTDFYFDAVLLYGHLHEDYLLKTEIQTSNSYGFDMRVTPPCSFSFILPDAQTPFALFLKISLLEGCEMAVASRHYGMKVVLAG